jgi:hypothetical protein
MVRIGTGDDAGQIVFVENFVEELRQRLTN